MLYLFINEKMHHSVTSNIIRDIRARCSTNITLTPKQARRFFKVSEGDYAFNDDFLGVKVPILRKIAKIYNNIELDVIKSLLQSRYNEERLIALYILVEQYQKGTDDLKNTIYEFYVSNISYVNNWNLVDSSAHHILGHYIFDKDRSILIKLALSDIIWERRISIISTLYFIRASDLSWTFKIAHLLINDSHDLIHKSVGWMLREAGKKDEKQLIAFLYDYGNYMPKTMLRYAIEKFSNDDKIAIKERLCK